MGICKHDLKPTDISGCLRSDSSKVIVSGNVFHMQASPLQKNNRTDCDWTEREEEELWQQPLNCIPQPSYAADVTGIAT